MEASFDYVAPGGRLVFVGLIQSRISFDDWLLHRRELTVLAKIVPRLQAESQVTAPVAGRVVPESARWIPQIGARVRKGQQLAVVEQTLTVPEKVQLVIDREKVEAALEQARHEMEVRKVEFERAKAMYEKKAGSLKQLQEAELAYQLAVSHHASALRQREVYQRAAAENNTDIKRFPILAPLSGVGDFPQRRQFAKPGTDAELV